MLVFIFDLDEIPRDFMVDAMLLKVNSTLIGER